MSSKLPKIKCDQHALGAIFASFTMGEHDSLTRVVVRSCADNARKCGGPTAHIRVGLGKRISNAFGRTLRRFRIRAHGSIGLSASGQCCHVVFDLVGTSSVCPFGVESWAGSPNLRVPDQLL